MLDVLVVFLLKGGEIRDTKTLNLSRNIVSLQVWSMFRLFHLAWSTWSATETFVAGRKNAALWLVDLPEREQICCALSCEFDEIRATKPKFVAQSRHALYFSQQLSSTSATNVFVARQVDYARWKNGKHRPKLATKQCCATSWGFLYLVFRRLKYPHKPKMNYHVSQGILQCHFDC